MEALFCTIIDDAHEGCDVPGLNIHEEMPKDKRILMNTRGDFVDIKCQVNPEYEQHVRYEKGEKVLYILVIRAIYGYVDSSLLWYNLFCTTL